MTIGISSFAPFDTSYPQRTPYITATEYNGSPNGMDTNNLVSGGAQANATALIEVIGRASSWVDQFTCGAWGTLCATQNVENARVWGSRDGTLRVHPKYWPILSVDTFSYSPLGNVAGASGLATSAASITPAGNIWVEPQEFVVSPSGSLGFGLSASWGITTMEYTTTFTYTNGWPQTTLAASVAAGATSIKPLNVTGIYPGTMLTLYDMPYDEAIQVSASYVPGSAVVPFAVPLSHDHAITATVTNLPPAIKEAAILTTTAFIKQRGSGALVVADMGAVTHEQTGGSQNDQSDLAQAKELLTPFKMQFVGY